MKKNADLICCVVGVFLTTYFLFDFTAGPGGLPVGPGEQYYYYYSDAARVGLATGASFVCLGILPTFPASM
jgi:hypothetical protein